MHRKSQLSLKGRNTLGTTELLLLVFVSSWMQFFAANPYVAEASSDHSRGCDQLTCRIGEQCVNRKFWCNHTPCPNMVYCSKSRKESLKGPESCESVLCTTGYKCIVRVRDCKWNQNCKQRAARCVTEQEYHEGPVSCTDVLCSKGYRCILRESHCFQPPCRLSKSCARTAEVHIWFDKCKQLSCRSEHDCFLRRPPSECIKPPCYHVPDCLVKNNLNDDSTLNEYCHGWICPPNQECSAHAEAPCKQSNCRVTRACYEPLLLRMANASRDFNQPSDILSPQTTLADIKREVFRDEQRKLQNFMKPASHSNMMRFVQNFPKMSSSTGVSASYKNPDYATVKSKRVTTIPNVRSTSFGESPWLTYLKRKAGTEAVQYWMEKARNDEDYEEFVEWMESVAGLLDSETYSQWLREVELASADVPEFQSWILPWNLRADRSGLSHRRPNDAGRSLHDDNARDDEARGSFPGSIDGSRAKDLFHGDRGFPLTKPNSDDQRSFMEKQRVPSMAPELESASQQQQRPPNPSNFNFNEANRSDRTSGYQRRIESPPSPSPPYLEIAHRRPGQDSALADLDHGPVPSRVRDFTENVKNSWKSRESYYRLNPSATNLRGFPAQATSRDSYYLSNHTRIRENFSLSVTPGFDLMRQQQQPQVFFPSSQNGYGNAALQAHANQWPNGLPMNRGTLDGSSFIGPNGRNGYELSPGDSMEFRSIVDQIAGLQQFTELQPNILKLDPYQPGPQFLLPSQTDEHSLLPNLLIYFPPPLNFIMYYSASNQSQSASQNSTSITNQTENNFNESKNDGSSVTEKPPATNVTPNNNTDYIRRPGKFDKRKALNYIRKIIKELIEYWDEEEKLLRNNEKLSDESSSDIRNASMADSKSKNKKEDGLEPNNNPSFNAFLDWLSKNTNDNSSFLEQKFRRRGSPDYNKSKDNTRNHQSHSENSNNANSKNIRILIDIDKNPDLMKALLERSKSGTKNETNSNEHQIVVNLKDFIDPREEDTVSQRLIDIATNQLHRNLSGNQKMPKTLWVFPIYNEEENNTLINEIARLINERLNTKENNFSTAKPKENEENAPPAVVGRNEERLTLDNLETSDYDENDDLENEDAMKDTNEDYEDEETYDESPNESIDEESSK